jgi:AcrR family transcriptional regulator
MSQKPKRKKNPQKRLRASESGTVADKRDALISAAAQAFHNRNFYEISMDDIAEALGVTKPTLYSYVRSKHEILYECHKRAMQCAELAAHEASTNGGTGLEQTKRFIERFVFQILDRGNGTSMMLYLDALPEKERAEISRKREYWRLYTETLIRRGQSDGTIRKIDPLMATMFAMGAISWLTKWYNTDGPMTPAVLSAGFAELFARGIRADPAL